MLRRKHELKENQKFVSFVTSNLKTPVNNLKSYYGKYHPQWHFN